jgi:hypothetical protein
LFTFIQARLKFRKKRDDLIKIDEIISRSVKRENEPNFSIGLGRFGSGRPQQGQRPTGRTHWPTGGRFGDKEDVESVGNPIGSGTGCDYSVERSFEKVSGLREKL